MTEVETKVVVKGLRQCVSDSQVLKDNLPLNGSYTQKYGGYTEDDFFKCEACGKILSADDKCSVHSKDTHEDIDICPHCYEFGCRVGSEDYSVCEGCGEDSEKCWVKDSDCFDTVEYDEISHNLRYSYVCSDIKEDFYAKCDSCGYYYFYENRNDCPKCHSDED